MYGATEDSDSSDTSSAKRWALLVAAALVQTISGAIYAAGAWQTALRDGLGTDSGGVQVVGACAFAGSLLATLGGRAFDAFGPRAACLLGGALATGGFVALIVALAGAARAPGARGWLALAAGGMLLVGFSSVSLLDNVVSMAASLSFPSERAAVVGWLKAVLATSAAFWALLWVHAFAPPDGLGLLAFLALSATFTALATLAAAPALRILKGPRDTAPFGDDDGRRLRRGLGATLALCLFCVGVAFLYSSGRIAATPPLAVVAFALALAPATLLQPNTFRVLGHGAASGDAADAAERAALNAAPRGDAAPPARPKFHASRSQIHVQTGVPFGAAATGLDFWLLFYVQFAVFGAGIATNQNLSMILESEGSPQFAGLGVALFALASTCSRAAVGLLVASPAVSAVVSKWAWLALVATCATLGEALVAVEGVAPTMSGVLLCGLAFGAFFTLVVPVVNECFGARDFGTIMGAQLASQFFSTVLFSLELLPTVYKAAEAAGSDVCHGANCYRESFSTLAACNFLALLASLWLGARNATSLPASRYAALHREA